MRAEDSLKLNSLAASNANANGAFGRSVSRNLKNMNMVDVYRAVSRMLGSPNPETQAGPTTAVLEPDELEGGPEPAAHVDANDVANVPPLTSSSASPSKALTSAQGSAINPYSMGTAELQALLRAHIRATSSQVRHGRNFLQMIPQLRQEIHAGVQKREHYELFLLGCMDPAVPLAIAWALGWLPSALEATVRGNFAPNAIWWVPAAPFLIVCLFSAATFTHGLWCMLHDPLWLAGGESILHCNEQPMPQVLQDCPPLPGSVAELDLAQDLRGDPRVTLDIVAALVFGVHKPGCAWVPLQGATPVGIQERITPKRSWLGQCSFGPPRRTESASWYRWSPVGHDTIGLLFHSACTFLAADRLWHPADRQQLAAAQAQARPSQQRLTEHGNAVFRGTVRSASAGLIVVSIASCVCLSILTLLLTLRLTGVIELASMRIVAPLLVAFSATLDIPCCRGCIGASLASHPQLRSNAYRNYETLCLPGFCGFAALPIFLYVSGVLGLVALGDNVGPDSGFLVGIAVLNLVAAITAASMIALATVFFMLRYILRAVWVVAHRCTAEEGGNPPLQFLFEDDFRTIAGQWRAQVVWRLVHVQFLAVMILIAVFATGVVLSVGSAESSPGTSLHFLHITCWLTASWTMLGAVVESALRCRRASLKLEADPEGAFARPGQLCGPAWFRRALTSSPCSCRGLCAVTDAQGVGMSQIQKDLAVLDAYHSWLTAKMERLRPQF